MAIDELLEGAIKEEHTRKAHDLQSIIDEMRVPKLLNFFERGLEGEELAEFQKLDEPDRIAKLRDSNYKIKDEFVDEMVESLTLYVLKTHNETAYNHMKESLEIKKDESKSIDERKDASRIVIQYMNMVKQFGIDPDAMKESGKTKGFNSSEWNSHTEKIGGLYKHYTSKSYLQLASDDEIKNYIKSIGDETGLKSDHVIEKGRDEMENVATLHHQYKKNKDIDGFKKAHHQYHD